MIEGIGLPQVGLGLGWLVAVAFTFALLRGQLVPRRTLDDQIHETNEWRAESRIKDAQIAEKDRQLRTIDKLSELVSATMRSIQRASKDGAP